MPSDNKCDASTNQFRFREPFASGFHRDQFAHQILSGLAAALCDHVLNIRTYLHEAVLSTGQVRLARFVDTLKTQDVIRPLPHKVSIGGWDVLDLDGQPDGHG